MKPEDYKQQFIELFKKMESELGRCNDVYIERNDVMDCNANKIVRTSYKCIIRF